MTRKASYQHTTTIQVWPGGESYTYRGDPEGDTNQRSIRTYQQHKGGAAGPFQTVGAWRKGTPAEWAAIVREVRAARIAEREVYCCDSGLVDDLLKNAGDSRIEPFDQFGYEEIRNVYADPSDWDADQCREYIREYAGVEDAHDTTDESEGTPALDALREQAREIASEHPAEVFEWWRVSQWLCDTLHAIGEVTIDNGYGCWFGRTVTGQNLLMDGTLQRVAATLEG